MSANSTIEWTDSTWNPVAGCTKITRGCDNCYAHRFAERWRGIPGHPYENGFDLTLHPQRLEQPLRWRKPRRIFVNSMSDLFHKEIERKQPGFTDRVFEVMEEAEQHQFQILTKRSSLMRNYMRRRYKESLAPPHIWCGVSVEDEKSAARIRHLRETPARIRFLSMEPLLGPVPDLDLSDIHWVIVGGESGPNAREMRQEWVEEIHDQCREQEVPFFFKQWGGRTPKAGGRMLHSREWNEYPAVTA